MKITIAERGESFEQTMTRNESTFETYKGCYIIGRWNGFEIKGIHLGYKFDTIDEAKIYIDKLTKQIEDAANSKVDPEWPETR